MPQRTSRRSSSPSASVGRPVPWGRLGGVAALALLALCDGRAGATGSTDDIDDYQSLFAPEIIERPDEAPFFLSGHLFYGNAGDGSPPFDTLEDLNAKEWSAYLNGRVPMQSLSHLIYKMKLPDLDKLIWAFEGKKQVLSAPLASLKSELDSIGNSRRVVQALYYLGFAKRCEPIALRMLTDDAWDAQKIATARAGDAVVAAKLLDGSKGLLASVADKFLQERYHFQRLRLYFYTGRNAEAEKYYTDNIGSFTTESSVKYRFISAAAGAYAHDKQYGRANYLYSVVFDRYAPLKRSAYMSFGPVEDADWKQSLALARSDHEKAVLWQLVGLRNDGLAAIEKIHALSPASPLLPLLLVREVNKSEEDVARAGEGRVAEEQARAKALGKKRLALIKRIADEKKTPQPYLYQLALGHLYVLTRDYASALSYLDQAEKSLPAAPEQAAAIREQLRMSQLYARLSSWKAADKAQEPYLLKTLESLDPSKNSRASQLRTWAIDKLRGLYTRSGEIPQSIAKADYGTNRKIDAILGYLDRPGKSPLVELLLKGMTPERPALLEMKTLNELYAGHFTSAQALLAQAGPTRGTETLRADPFLIHIRDCHDCDFAANEKAKGKAKAAYTLATLIARFIELSKQAGQKGEAGAQASFLIANGLYNLSYYGNARDVYSGTSSDDLSRNRDMTQAEKYYKRAMELSADQEFKAKACFMAAKTEQNRRFKDSSSYIDGPASPIYFKMLKDSYANTRYYQEIIKECGYFRTYLKR